MKQPLGKVSKPSLAENENGEPQQYEVEDAANTLMKAEDIKNNKKLMPHVHKHLAKKKKAMEKISSIDQLRVAANSKNDNDGDE